MSSITYTSDLTFGQPPSEPSEIPLNKFASGVASATMVGAGQSHLTVDTTHEKVRPFNIFHKDVEPLNSSTLRFGDQCTIKYGDEFPGALIGAEIHVRLPRIFRNTNTAAFTQANGNPLLESTGLPDPAYVALAGSATDFIDWAPCVGELILGGLTGYLEEKHNLEVLHRYRPFEITWKRRLCENDQSSQDRSIYLNGVGGDRSLPTNVAHDLIIRVWLSHCRDGGRTLRQPRIASAFAEKYEINFPIAPLADILQTNVNMSEFSTTDSRLFPRIFLRTFFYNTPGDEKAAMTMALINSGYKFKVHRVITENLVEVAANSVSEVETAIEVQYPKLPVAYSMIVAQYKDDLKQTGATAIQEDIDTNPLTKRCRPGTTTIQRANWRSVIPIKKWRIDDNSERHTNVYDMKHWLTSQMNGYSNYFPSSITAEVAVIPAALMPAVEQHSTGHRDFTTFSKPRIYLTLPPNDAKNPSQIRVVRVMHVINTFVKQKAGSEWPVISHQL